VLGVGLVVGVGSLVGVGSVVGVGSAPGVDAVLGVGSSVGVGAVLGDRGGPVLGVGGPELGDGDVDGDVDGDPATFGIGLIAGSAGRWGRDAPTSAPRPAGRATLKGAVTVPRTVLTVTVRRVAPRSAEAGPRKVWVERSAVSGDGRGGAGLLSAGAVRSPAGPDEVGAGTGDGSGGSVAGGSPSGGGVRSGSWPATVGPERAEGDSSCATHVAPAAASSATTTADAWRSRAGFLCRPAAMAAPPGPAVGSPPGGLPNSRPLNAPPAV
jgi:hypothetical protein